MATFANKPILYTPMKKLILASLICLWSVSCEKEISQVKTEQLPPMENISLNHRGQNVQVELPMSCTDVKVKTQYGSYWIDRLTCNNNIISFYAVENSEVDRGYRVDTIRIYSKNTEIGNICVVQARNNVSPMELKWALPQAIYYKTSIDGYKYTGEEITRMVYNLEKETNGKDSYKNYPAFAYCIDMNIDPENNMEWHLPDIGQMEKCRGDRQDYMDTPFAEHSSWWSASDINDCAQWLKSSTIASHGPNPKHYEHHVMAFRNGRID